MLKEIEASHPFHTSRPGIKGGSKPAVHNDHVKVVSACLGTARQGVESLKAKLPNPVSRLKG